MPLDLGDLDLSGISDALNPGFSNTKSKYGPARTRVGRWVVRTNLALLIVMAFATLVVWLRADSVATFDQTGLPVIVLGCLAFLAMFLVHVVAAIIAVRIDRRRGWKA